MDCNVFSVQLKMRMESRPAFEFVFLGQFSCSDAVECRCTRRTSLGVGPIVSADPVCGVDYNVMAL